MKAKTKAQHLNDQQIIDYYYELAEPAAIESAKKHIKKCKACQRRVAELHTTLDQLDLVHETVKAPDELIVKTVRRVTAPASSTESTSSATMPAANVIAWPRIAWIGFAAAAAVAVAIVLPKFSHKTTDASVVAMTASAKNEKSAVHAVQEVHALRDAKMAPANEPIPVELAKDFDATLESDRREQKQPTDKERMLVAAPAAPKPTTPSASQFRASGEAAAVGGSLAAATPAPVAAPPATVARSRITAKPVEKPAVKPVMLAAANDELKPAAKMSAPAAAAAPAVAAPEQKPVTLSLETAKAKPVVVASAPTGAVTDGIARDAAMDLMSESLRGSELVHVTLPSSSGMWQTGAQGTIRIRASCDEKEVRLRLSNQGIAERAEIQVHPLRSTNVLLSVMLEAGATTNVTVKIPAKANH